MKELLARVRALSRRPIQLQMNAVIEYKDIHFNQTQLYLTGPRGSCTLSKRESSLLEVFLQNPNTLLPRQFIYSKVWGPDSFVEDGNIDNYIRFLRRRLKTIHSMQKIRTVRGVGYILEDCDAT
ncbi:MAG: winged helix-turn-helix domain-containing protein [Cellulosilyticum sp.]|nr:winged helix-turn-helix domain-containing protein [Cellulosilyticum sp.]